MEKVVKTLAHRDDLFHVVWYGVADTRARDMEEEVESLPEALCYKQRLEKSTGAEMFLMKWSPVADLLAAACTDHSVSQVNYKYMSPVRDCRDSFIRC